MKRREFLAASVTSGLATLGTGTLKQQAEAVPSRVRHHGSWVSDNIFLQGINAPVFDEVDIDNLSVTGTIPADLEGIYIRNGANPMFRPTTYHYPLEGDGMLHAVYFHDAKARYRNRWIVTKGLLYQMQAGQALPELRFSNCANTNIIAHAGTLLALYEIGLPYQITPELETVGEWNFQGATNRTMTAHPHLDPETGELHFYRYSFFTQPYLTYYVADAKGNLLRELPLALPRPGLLHDMALSENYAIFFHCPLVFDFQQAMQCGTPFVWNPNYGTRIGLIHRHDLQQPPIWIETEPFWVWHFMNAFEANGQVTVDFAYYPAMSLDNHLASVLAHQSTFRRAVIDPQTKTVHYQPLDDRIVEFPTFDRRRTGKPYQFGYMSHLDLDWITQTGIPNYFSELIQYDVINQTSRVHRFPAGCYGSEAAVIPKSSGQSESDSYVMCWVYNEPQQTSDLVILDASRFDEAPIAQIHLPVRVPMGAHGNWIAQSALG